MGTTPATVLDPEMAERASDMIRRRTPLPAAMDA
jgi:hypothetical protein